MLFKDFGDKNDGRGTLYQKYVGVPAFKYLYEPPLHIQKLSVESSKRNVFSKLMIDKAYNFDKFLVAPERKNVWHGVIRSQCEGVLSAKTYINPNDDRGVYTVIPEIEGAENTVDEVYKMWLALECAMMRRESLIIVEDPALAYVTKFRTEQWRLLNRFVRWGCSFSMTFAFFFPTYHSFYLFPFALAFYGYGVLHIMKTKDPASRYSECCLNKQYETDPESHFVCDAQISLKYLRCSHFRMFMLENHEERDEKNLLFVLAAAALGILQLFRTVYRENFVPPFIQQGYGMAMLSTGMEPLNVFEQLKKRFVTFGNPSGAGRTDPIHWAVQNGLFYYFCLRHISWAIQTCLEYLDREYVMETTIRYLQFRNLCGEERYEFPARNLYWTMQKDFPNNRILKELYDHYNDPSADYYTSEEFLSTRKPEKISLSEALRRCKISYIRNW